MEEGEAGVDCVGFAAKGAEHVPGFGEVGRFVEDGFPQGDGGVGSQDEGVGVAGGYGTGFDVCVHPDEAIGGEAACVFKGVGLDDTEFPTGFGEQFFAPG